MRIIVDESGEKPEKRLALVRDAGMMITDQVRDMRLTNSRQMLRMSRSWKGFTAIVECLSQGERSLLREAEGPHHDKISRTMLTIPRGKPLGMRFVNWAVGLWHL